MRRKGKRWIWAALAALGLGLAGCGDSNLFEGSGDTNSDQAQREEGIQALNDGDWAEARRIWEARYGADPSPENAKYLASAYVGEAGFDTLQLIVELSDDEDGDASADKVYENVASIFDDNGDGWILADDLSAKLAWIRLALEKLEPPLAPGKVSAAVAGPDWDEDAVFQKGLYAALDAVLSVAQQLVDPENPARLVLTQTRFDELTADQKNQLILAVGVPAGLDADLAAVRQAVAVLDPTLLDGADEEDGSEVAQELDRFLRDIGYLDPAGNVTGVSELELEDYLASIFGITLTRP